jgi:glutaredoxin
MYGVSWCGDCRAARRFLESHGIEYTEIDVDRDREASAEVVRRVGKRAVPQLVIDGEWFQPYKPGRGLLFLAAELVRVRGFPPIPQRARNGWGTDRFSRVTAVGSYNQELGQRRGMRFWLGVSLDRTLYPAGDGPHLD